MTKLEEVARALWNAESVRATDRPRRVEWAEESDKTQENWRRMARAAIEALREPTTDMCNAGADELDTFDPADQCPSPWDMERGYRAMIDAILKEGD